MIFISSQSTATLQALPLLLKARGATQLMLPSPRALLASLIRQQCCSRRLACCLERAGRGGEPLCAAPRCWRAQQQASVRCPSLLKAREATQLMLSSSCLLCVFESSAAPLTAAGVLLGARRAQQQFRALPLAAEGKRGYSTHALFASCVTLCL